MAAAHYGTGTLAFSDDYESDLDASPSDFAVDDVRSFLGSRSQTVGGEHRPHDVEDDSGFDGHHGARDNAGEGTFEPSSKLTEAIQNGLFSEEIDADQRKEAEKKLRHPARQMREVATKVLKGMLFQGDAENESSKTKKRLTASEAQRRTHLALKRVQLEYALRVPQRESTLQEHDEILKLNIEAAGNVLATIKCVFDDISEEDSSLSPIAQHVLTGLVLQELMKRLMVWNSLLMVFRLQRMKVQRLIQKRQGSNRANGQLLSVSKIDRLMAYPQRAVTSRDYTGEEGERVNTDVLIRELKSAGLGIYTQHLEHEQDTSSEVMQPDTEKKRYEMTQAKVNQLVRMVQNWDDVLSQYDEINLYDNYEGADDDNDSDDGGDGGGALFKGAAEA